MSDINDLPLLARLLLPIQTHVTILYSTVLECFLLLHLSMPTRLMQWLYQTMLLQVVSQMGWLYWTHVAIDIVCYVLYGHSSITTQLMSCITQCSAIDTVSYRALTFGLLYSRLWHMPKETCETCHCERLTVNVAHRFICGKCVEILKALYKAFPQLRPK